MFNRLLHADWSKHDRKRVAARAVRTAAGWSIEAPRRVGPLTGFLDEICEPAMLCGFDFPIGLPAAFGAATGLSGFLDALIRFGDGAWSDFFLVATEPEEISLHRPFYPDRPGGTSRRQLFEALGVAAADLLRACERASGTRAAASPLFWTMGAKQVGKAAITGWRDVLRLARPRCALWPFDGDLGALAASGRTVLAEAYPAEACGQIGLRFANGASKRRQSDRAAFAPALHGWAGRAGACFAPELVAQIDTGFGPLPDGEDRFDAFVGLLGMIEVADGRRPDAPATVDRVWEGWILGQHGGRA